MNGEFDIELYTIAMTRLNNGFAKVGDIIQENAAVLNSENEDEEREKKLDKMAVSIKRTLPDFKNACKEFKDLYADIESDLNSKEINLNDYEPFFKHVQETFPQSSIDLEKGIKGIQDAVQIATGPLDYAVADLAQIIDEILATFTALYSLSCNTLEKIQKGELR
ncbi:MAG: hypothetical protein Q4P18_04225 [Methanobrevibacter sp.]|uniref:hypothetical protein n=1 Tax=Methanobrevibacter sp. TaxID=66852 RepID=UPI0026E10F41|nr:hypothetical protein [Methanobrevibacter sp.]MDO5848718.1 hypothetical protein [Methanobrevibacter sp.]